MAAFQTLLGLASDPNGPTTKEIFEPQAELGVTMAARGCVAGAGAVLCRRTPFGTPGGLANDPLIARFCGLARIGTPRTVANRLRQFTRCWQEDHGVEEIMTVDEARRILCADQVAQYLLGSTSIARLAYTWRDGTPRVVPMWFQWTGDDILVGAPPDSPKMKVLTARPQVAVSIDSIDWPYKWLNVRGTASVRVSAEPFAEYLTMARRYLGEAGGEQFLTALRQTFHGWARIAILPKEVRILDFEGRFPSASANPLHLPPTSVAMVGKTDRANHLYDLRWFWRAARAGHLPAVSFLKAPAYQNGHPGHSDPLDEQVFLVNGSASSEDVVSATTPARHVLPVRMLSRM